MSRGKDNVAREVIYSPTIVDRLAEGTDLDPALVDDVVRRLRTLIDERWDAELRHGRPSERRTP